MEVEVKRVDTGPSLHWTLDFGHKDQSRDQRFSPKKTKKKILKKVKGRRLNNDYAESTKRETGTCTETD